MADVSETPTGAPMRVLCLSLLMVLPQTIAAQQVAPAGLDSALVARYVAYKISAMSKAAYKDSLTHRIAIDTLAGRWNQLVGRAGGRWSVPAGTRAEAMVTKLDVRLQGDTAVVRISLDACTPEGMSRGVRQMSGHFVIVFTDWDALTGQPISRFVPSGVSKCVAGTHGAR